MPLTTVLLLTLVLAATPQQAPQPGSAASNDNAYLVAGRMPGPSFELTPGTTGDTAIVAPGDDVCYRIRAYIFKRDDDHAPELVRSTTCGPKTPREKDAALPQPRLVPAK